MKVKSSLNEKKDETPAQRARKIDIVQYLASININPAKQPKGANYWYFSPFRKENTPSFVVNRIKNKWYDWGEGVGGNIIDFGIRHHNCSVSDFLKMLNEKKHLLKEPILTENIEKKSAKDEGTEEIKVIHVLPLTSFPLLRYLEKRRIHAELARKYCSEVWYKLNGKNYYAIGFQNNAGGYELRNEYIKAASSPKDITFIDNDAKDNLVIEGYFNFLSYKTLYLNLEEPHRNYLILNSTSFFKKSLPLMQSYERNFLFLDNDKTGEKFTKLALSLNKEKFIDERKLYSNYNDLNDWLINLGRTEKHRLLHKL